MELSSKITRSVCLFLESQGCVVGDYLSLSDISTEVALDSERWIQAYKVENFLEQVSRQVQEAQPKKIAQQAPSIKGWGLLDQVLRIIQSPSEIYENPQNFLAYFVDAELKTSWIKREKELSVFKVDFFTDEYPLVTSYLAGALEAVSTFSGGQPALVNWSEGLVSIDWSKRQESIFENNEPMNLKPEFYKEAVDIITKQQQEISALKEKVKIKNFNGEIPAGDIINCVSQLQDYFLRSRQLVSLLQAESGKKKWFKDALKRLNWKSLEAFHKEKSLEIHSILKGETPVKNSQEPEQAHFTLKSQ